MRKILILLALLIGLTAGAQAQTVVWTNQAASGNFSNWFAFNPPFAVGVTNTIIYTNALTQTITNSSATFLGSFLTTNTTFGNLTIYPSSTLTITGIYMVAGSASQTTRPMMTNTVATGVLAVTNGGGAKLIVGDPVFGGGVLAINARASVIADQLYATNTLNGTNSLLTINAGSQLTILNGSTIFLFTNSLWTVNGGLKFLGGYNNVTNWGTTYSTINQISFPAGSTTTVSGAGTTLNFGLSTVSGKGISHASQLIVSNQANLTYQGVNYLMFTSTTTVNNATLVISNTVPTVLLYSSPNANINVTNGATFYNGSPSFTIGQTGPTNVGVTVSGGSCYTNVGQLFISYKANLLTPSAFYIAVLGGSTFCGEGSGTPAGNYLGYGSGAYNSTNLGNYLVVSDAGSRMEFQRDLIIGYVLLNNNNNGLSCSSYLSVSNSAVAVLSNLIVSASYILGIASNGISTNNYAIVNNSRLYVTNALSNGSITLGDSSNQFTWVQASLIITNNGFVGSDLFIAKTNSQVYMNSGVWTNSGYFLNGVNSSSLCSIFVTNASRIYTGYGLTNYGTLSICAASSVVSTGNAYFGAGSILSICFNSDTPTSGLISASAVVSGGTLTFSDLGGGTHYTNGATFNVFNYSSISGNFLATNYPTLNSWNLVSGNLIYTVTVTSASSTFNRLQPNATFQLQPNQKYQVNPQ